MLTAWESIGIVALAIIVAPYVITVFAMLFFWWD